MFKCAVGRGGLCSHLWTHPTIILPQKSWFLRQRIVIFKAKNRDFQAKESWFSREESRFSRQRIVTVLYKNAHNLELWAGAAWRHTLQVPNSSFVKYRIHHLNAEFIILIQISSLFITEFIIWMQTPSFKYRGHHLYHEGVRADWDHTTDGIRCRIHLINTRFLVFVCLFDTKFHVFVVFWYKISRF